MNSAIRAASPVITMSMSAAAMISTAGHTRNPTSASTRTTLLACGHVRFRAERLGEDGKALGNGSVVDLSASLVAVEEPGLMEHLEVMAHRWLRDAEWFDQLASADFLPCCDHAVQPQAGGIGENSEPAGQQIGLLRIKGRLADGLATRGDGHDGQTEGLVEGTHTGAAFSRESPPRARLREKRSGVSCRRP